MYADVMGIDLGTTYSCVSLLSNGKPEIINNAMSHNTTPSVVAFEGKKILVGEAAKNKMQLNPETTVYDAKRLIGRNFNDIEVQNDKKKWPFTVDCDKNNKPLIRVTSKAVDGTEITQEMHPEEISAQVLMNLAECASARAGKEIKKAVITVPAYFNNEQRLATKRAGELAGLEVIGIINEPTAAALAYGVEFNCDNNTILVFDFGGGTFDVSVLRANGSDFDVLGTNGNTHLGGADVDQIIVDMCIEDLIKKELIKDEDDLTPSQKALLRIKAEDLKKNLCTSTAKYMIMELPEFIDGKDYEKKISIASFNNACIDLFNDCLSITEDCLGQIRRPGQEPEEDPEGIEPEEINNVIFVGGSTRIQKVREMVQEMFPKSEVCTALNPDEAVAKGAVFYAASKLNIKIDGYPNGILIRETTPINLGIKAKGEDGKPKMSVVLPKNSHTKQRQTKVYASEKDNQEYAKIFIYEGDELDNLYLNEKIGEFRVKFPPGSKKGTEVKVSFMTDEFGILEVTADVSGGGKESIKIEAESHVQTEMDVLQMKMRVEESKEKLRIQKIQENIISLYEQANTLIEDLDYDQREEINYIIKEIEKYKDEEIPSITMESIEVLRNKLNQYQ